MEQSQIRQLFPMSNLLSSPDEIYTGPELAFPTEGMVAADGKRRPYVYFNMVSSVDGRAITAAGSAEGLGTPTDRRLMHRLRLAADAVLVGAETFRRDAVMPTFNSDLAEERARYFPDLPQPWGIVLSGDGKLPLNKKFFHTGPEYRVVALGQKTTAEREATFEGKARIVRVPDDKEGHPNIEWLLAYLYRELGISRLLCEGGPNLNYSFISKGLGDEVFWTLAPRLVAGSDNSAIINGPIFPMDKMPRLTLRSLYEQDDEMFFRHKIEPKV